MSTSETSVEVSIVIPVFNPGRFLAEQLSALARQGQSNGGWELILADNGTTDGSLDDLEPADHALPLRVVDASGRRGPAHARNVGAREARGTWLFFCDSDDVVGSNWLDRLWAARTEADIVTGALDVVALNPEGSLQARGGPEYGRSLPQGPCRFLSYASSGNMAVSRSLFLDLGGWDEDLLYCEDVDFSWRAQLAGYTLGFAPEAVMHYRFRPDDWALFMQMRRYKAAEVALYRRYRSQGAERQSIAEAGRLWWWTVSRLPYLVASEGRRSLWWSIAGTILGRLEGSWRERVWYP